MAIICRVCVHITDLSTVEDASRRVIFVGDIHGMRESLEFVYVLLRARSKEY